MKAILLSAMLLVLFGTVGCEIEGEHHHHGGYYGNPEYGHGYYEGGPGYYHHRDWDDRD